MDADAQRIATLPTGHSVLCPCDSCRYLRLDEDEQERFSGLPYYSEDERVPCGCLFCTCFNDTTAGEVCSECRNGAHQG